MAERYLTFAEVEQTLGLSADEVRNLMESRALSGTILDGVVKFPESQVLAVHDRGAPKPGSRDADEMALKFLVDEEEEEQIEGRPYEGEDLLKPGDASMLAPDEEIMEPVGL